MESIKKKLLEKLISDWIKNDKISEIAKFESAGLKRDLKIAYNNYLQSEESILIDLIS